VRRTVPRTTARCIGLCGLITCFGACTVMLGREVLPEGSVSAIAAPLRLNSIIAVDAMAIARFEKKRDENFIVMSPEVRGQPIEEASSRKRHCDTKSNVVACKATALPARRLIRQRMAGISSSDRGSKPGSTLFFAATAFPKANDSRGSAVRYRASIRMRYLFRFSAVTRNFPPASMPVQNHQDRCRSQPRNILVSTHCT
jgi:hypothetical protein